MLQLLVFALIIGLPYAGLLYLLWFYKRETARLSSEVEQLLRTPLRTEASMNTQRAVLRGQLAEQVAPLLNGFPFQPGDYMHIGNSVDFLAVVGLTQAKDDPRNGIKELVIGDIKSGSARLSPLQESIKRAVDAGRVRWETVNIDREFRVKRGGGI